MLRDYQQAAHDAAIKHIKKCLDPCVIEAATGAGKSHIIAAIADTFYKISGKRVLCTAPSGELVLQNHEKYIATGSKASIFSASAGRKCLQYPVVFGTPGTIKNRIRAFSDEFGMVVIDEAHGITPTIKTIIESMSSNNSRLRVVGLSATPYRLQTGLIYAIDEDDKPSSSEECREPYFTKKVYTVRARELIAQGFLTHPTIGALHADVYKTSSMELNKLGKFNSEDIDKAYHGQGRKTAAIIADIVLQSRDRSGVMLFCATVKHALEAMESLPPELSAIVTAETPKAERANILKRFKAKSLKYLVNVAVLTTGFDAPHVDVVALLRATESVGLLQQIVGRGLRIDGLKQDCLILDYAENLERHCPDGDIFAPEIKAQAAKKSSTIIIAECPLCKVENEFSARPNEEGYGYDNNGFFTDLDGNVISTEYGATPSHYGRRCLGLHLISGSYKQCTYRWTYKECPNCQTDNDIAARYCTECKGELVNPNDKLIADFKALKRDPTRKQTDKVLSWNIRKTISKTGNECMAVDFITEFRKFTIWYQIRSGNAYHIKQYEKFIHETDGMQIMPFSITYQKEETGFYKAFAYNREIDKEPTKC